MTTVISILIILAAILLAVVVLIQNPKEGGLTSSLSSANKIGGVQKTANVLEKATWILAVTLMVLCVAYYNFDEKAQAKKSQVNPTEQVESAPGE